MKKNIKLKEKKDGDFVLTAEQNNKLVEMYDIYNTIIKPLIADIEASYNSIPQELLNEIRAYNDHLSRIFSKSSNDEIIDTQLSKAFSHIKRLVYDCYKYLIVYTKHYIDTQEKKLKHIDLTVIDNGRFHTEYMDLEKDAHTKEIEAKKVETKNESVGNFEDNVLNYQKAYEAYVKLEDFLYVNTQKINWAKRKFYKNKVLAIIGSLMLFILGAIASLFIENLPFVQGVIDKCFN